MRIHRTKAVLVLPLLKNKNYKEASVFNPDNLLREARRQKKIGLKKVPKICILDPDGDIVTYLLKEKKAKLNQAWACYHTNLYNFVYYDIEFGIIGSAVGASFAVLVAEELFSSGCKFLVSMSSAGRIIPLNNPPPYFVLIKKALRDEGTSCHYSPPSQYSKINKALLKKIAGGFKKDSQTIYVGSSWTTDAPFRETKSAIASARSKKILAVEMEAAALYAFASSRKKSVVCFAHVTNQMGNIRGDFEKGADSGSVGALKVISYVAKKWLNHNK